MAFFRVVTILGWIAGGAILITRTVLNGAPQVAAAAVVGIGFAISPSCFGRAIEKMGGPGRPSRWTPAAVDDVVICPSCGKSIRPRARETGCYLCGGELWSFE